MSRFGNGFAGHSISRVTGLKNRLILHDDVRYRLPLITVLYSGWFHHGQWYIAMSRLTCVLFGGNYIYRYIVYHMHGAFLPLGYAMNRRESVQRNMQKDEKGSINQPI